MQKVNIHNISIDTIKTLSYLTSNNNTQKKCCINHSKDTSTANELVTSTPKSTLMLKQNYKTIIIKIQIIITKLYTTQFNYRSLHKMTLNNIKTSNTDKPSSS